MELELRLELLRQLELELKLALLVWRMELELDLELLRRRMELDLDLELLRQLFGMELELHHPGKLLKYGYRYSGFFFHAIHSTRRSHQKTPFLSCVIKRLLKVETLSTETVES
jgi:hypothetical protein